MSLAASVLDGNRLALARLLTEVENGSAQGQAGLNELFPHTGQAHLIGVTGAPGTGKSSLVNQLAQYYRRQVDNGAGRRVGVIAVDPSSPFTGGALLGDRVRMRDLAGDPGVFIRSMASRGALGGLAAATAAFAQVLDAAGFEVVLVETVGAGQDEVDIARMAQTTIVIEAPGLGDDIQAIKAGILEIADVLVVNKADRPGVENTERALRNMLMLAEPTQDELAHHPGEAAGETSGTSANQTWKTPVLRTVATEGAGITEVVQALEAHRAYLKSSGEWERREQKRLETELRAYVQTSLMERWRSSVGEERYQGVFKELVSRAISPGEAARKLLDGGRG